MPLLDHFHEPVYPRHRWEAFHGAWAHSLAAQLNSRLPSERFLAEATTHSGTYVEADVAEFELGPPPSLVEGNGAHGGVAVQVYAPPAAVCTVPMIFPDDFEVEIFDMRGGRTLV